MKTLMTLMREYRNEMLLAGILLLVIGAEMNDDFAVGIGFIACWEAWLND